MAKHLQLAGEGPPSAFLGNAGATFLPVLEEFGRQKKEAANSNILPVFDFSGTSYDYTHLPSNCQPNLSPPALELPNSVYSFEQSLI